MPGLPPIPIPPEPSMSIEELAEAGHSVLNELGLISWWKPSGYFRMALEAMHNHLDLPWWTTIMCGMYLQNCYSKRTRREFMDTLGIIFPKNLLSPFERLISRKMNLVVV